jgi:hypothetical protein
VDDEPGDVEPSLFEQMCHDAAGPFVIELPDGPGHVIEWTVDRPDADGVCELDQLDHPSDMIDVLVGDDDVADELLDHLDPLPYTETLQVCGRLRGHFALTVLPLGLWQHLVERIDCYGAAVEADLFDRGHDLLDWFRGLRPWPQLARVLDHLPEGSRYRAAILDDEDLALERIEAGIEPPTSTATPPLEGETQDRMLLRALVSTAQRIEHATYAVHAKKGAAGRPPRPLRGPQTAEDRLREQYADADVEDLFDQVTPGWRDRRAPDPPPAGFTERSSGLYVPS